MASNMFCRRKNTHYGPRRAWPMCAWLFICILMLSMSGCPLGAVVALFAKRDPMVSVAPEYEFLAGHLLVLVDCPTERTGLSGIRPLLTSELMREIEQQNLAPTLIPAGELATLRISTQDFSQLSIAEIGRHLSADQVLYVQVIEFSLGTLADKPAGQGQARVRVSVFDVLGDRRVWPKDQPLGREVLLNTPFREPTGQDYRQEFAEDLSNRLAQDIVKFFRQHEELRKTANEQ